MASQDGLEDGAAAVEAVGIIVCFEGELNFNKSAGSDSECLLRLPCSSLTPRKCELRPPFESSVAAQADVSEAALFDWPFFDC